MPVLETDPTPVMEGRPEILLSDPLDDLRGVQEAPQANLDDLA